MSATFDVAVIGAGPAGAAAALAAARAGLSVALFEPQLLPDKPCGEGILPSGIVALRALGLAGLLVQAPPLTRIRYVLASGRELQVELPAAGCALERPALSAALQEALARESRVALFRTRVSTRREPRGFRLDAGPEGWEARTLIAADGLLGRSAPWLRREPRAVHRYGLRARAEARLPLEHVEVHLGRSSEVYLTPLAGGRINVAVLRDELPRGERASAAWLETALREHPRAARRLGAWLTPPEARALPRAIPRRVADSGAFLAGDATGGIDPVLGCGVALALSTGIAAARAARRKLERGSGAPERAYARFVADSTRFPRTLAGALIFLARHPAAQGAVGRALEVWPAAGDYIARRIAYVRHDAEGDEPPEHGIRPETRPG